VIEVQLFVAVLGCLKLHVRRGGPGRQTLPDWNRLAHPALRLPRRRRHHDGLRQLEGGHHQGLLLRTVRQPQSYAEMAAHYETADRARARPPQARATRPKSRSVCCWRHAGIIAQAPQVHLLLSRRVEQGHRRRGSPPSTARVTRHLGASRRGDVRGHRAAGGSKHCRRNLTSTPNGRSARSGLDYHVEVEEALLLGPPTSCRARKVWARITARTVEIFHHGKRVAAHVRSSSNRKHTTDVRAHARRATRHYADWTPERASGGGLARIGGQHLSARRRDPARGARTRTGLPLVPRHPAIGQDRTGLARWRRACERALAIGGALLQVRPLDPDEQPRSPAARARHGRAAIVHSNIRGPGYFH